MNMRHSIQPVTTMPAIPLLEASDLPGAEDWSVLESLQFDESFDADDDGDDRFATLSVASGFDD
jgi:hypothetical protein